MISSVRITFRRLTDDDLPLLHRWLNEPGIVRWWEGDDVSWDGVVGTYSPAEAGRTEHWIASLEGRDLGWIQCWPCEEEPTESEIWWAAGLSRSSGGIDYLIAEPGDRGRGLGSAMIRQFVHEVVFVNHPEWEEVAADPQVANSASWGALRRAGFSHLADIDTPVGPCRLMVTGRVPSPPVTSG